jgi:SAM-dependent methyltransferase
MLPLDDSSFDAVLCIDSICHMPDRFAALSEWCRLLRRGGRLVFTDPFVLTGVVAKSEIDARATLTSNLFIVPPGLNKLLRRRALQCCVAKPAQAQLQKSLPGGTLRGFVARNSS